MPLTDRTYTAIDGQSIFDVAVQEYGHIDGVVWLCQDNHYLHIPYNFNTVETSNMGGRTFTLRQETISQKTIDELRPFNPIISKK
jgi:hypothetical protein